jgi:hypothetical protein
MLFYDLLGQKWQRVDEETKYCDLFDDFSLVFSVIYIIE